jgi:hypothetical protein
MGQPMFEFAHPRDENSILRKEVKQLVSGLFIIRTKRSNSSIRLEVGLKPNPLAPRLAANLGA